MSSAPKFQNLVEMFERSIELYKSRDLFGTRKEGRWEWTTYKAFGAAGLITSGAARDLDQVEAMHFPCFADGAICAHGYCHILQINVPVHVGGRGGRK